MSSRLNAKQQANAAAAARVRPETFQLLAFWGPNPFNAWLRSYNQEQPVFAALTREFPGPFANWEFYPGPEEGVYKIRNSGVGGFVAWDGQVGSKVTANGSEDNAANWRLQPAGDNFWTIKDPQQDLTWTMDDTGARSEITVQPSNGSAAQKFIKQGYPNAA